MSKTIDSLLKLKNETGVSEETFLEGIKEMIKIRNPEAYEIAKRKYGADLLIRAYHWCDENLSPMEFEQIITAKINTPDGKKEINPYQGMLLRYAEESGECTSGEIKKVYGGNKFVLAHNPFETEVDRERLVWNDKGELVGERAPKKVKSKLPPIPSEKKMKEMPLEDMKKIIDAHRSEGESE